jgi:hypothetical protein
MRRLGTVRGVAVRGLGAVLVATVALGTFGTPASLHAGTTGSARYSGEVSYYGRPAPDGALLTVNLGPDVVAASPVTRSEGQSAFSVTVPGDDPRTPRREGPRENDTLTFRVNGVPTDQTETYNDLEDRTLGLTVTRIGICVGAYEDRDRDLVHDPDEPWLADVVIHVVHFRTDLSYRTTGQDEPYCNLFAAEPKDVRAVDWPAQFDPPAGQGQPAVHIDQTEGVFTVAFPFVRLGAAGTGTPDVTPGATPTPTSPPSPPTSTPVTPASATPAPATPATGPTPTGATPSAGVTTELWVDSTADPGTVGDDRLTLREAMRLAVGDLALSALSAAERQHVTGPTGADVHDVIRFDPVVFPPGLGAAIFVQPPPDPGPQTGRWVAATSVCRPVFWSPPKPSLPPLSTGGDTIDATGATVTLAGELAGDLFDGLVITSDGNALRGLRLRSFNAGVLLYGTARGNTIGGADGDQGLTISQSIAGVVLHGADVAANVVVGNVIGASPDGAPGNATHGVLVAGGAHDNVVGQPGVANVVGDNAASGVAVVGGGTRGNVIAGNRIGTNLTGDRAVPNAMGVVVGCGASDNVVGGLTADAANLIGGNTGEGVWLLSPESQGNAVLGNVIGLGVDRWTALPNQGNGVLVSDGASNHRIGGSEPGAGNVIADNFGAGVRVVGAASTGIAVRRNSITGNGAGGIVLEGGANGRLPAPVVTYVASPAVMGWAPPGTLVEVYSDEGGQGHFYEGDARAGADGLFRFQGAQPLHGPNITALAVDGVGNTSPFGGVGVPPATATAGPSATPEGAGSVTYLPLVLRDQVLFALVTLEPAAAQVPMGGLVTLEVRVRGARNLFGMQWMIDFPAQGLEVIDDDPGTVGIQIAPGDFPDPGRVFVADNRANNVTGVISYAFTLVEGPPANGDGLIARIRFRGRAPGVASVHFRELALADEQANELAAHGLDATINVLPPPTATAPPSPTGTVVPSLTPTPSPSRPATATARPSDTATITPTARPTNTATITPTARPTDTATITPTPSATQLPSDTPVPSVTPLASDTPAPTRTVAPTDMPSATATARATETTRPTHTPPPSVTPVPTGDPCQRPLVNPGFETDAAWVLQGGRPPRYSDAMAHSGRRSLYLGIAPGEANAYAYSTTWQPVTVPANTTTMAVSAWTFQGAEPGGGADRQLVLVYDVNPADNTSAGRAPIAVVVAERSNAQAWQRRSLTMDVTAWRGKTLWFYASVVNDGLGGRAYMLLDDTEVAFCP